MKHLKWIGLTMLFSLSAFGAEFTAADVAKHSTAKDCWMVIKGRVYDVSSYVTKHPAPEVALTNYCGKIADTGWTTKDKGKPHSPGAERLLKKFEVGVLK